MGISGKNPPEDTDVNTIFKVKAEDPGMGRVDESATGRGEEKLGRAVLSGSVDRVCVPVLAKWGGEAYKQEVEDADVVTEDWLDVADTLLSFPPV